MKPVNEKVDWQVSKQVWGRVKEPIYTLLTDRATWRVRWSVGRRVYAQTEEQIREQVREEIR